MRTLFLLLYGTGMRIGEALSLTLQDVDLENRVLMVRDSKFFKTRLVPIGPRLTRVTDSLRRCQLPLLAARPRLSWLRTQAFVWFTSVGKHLVASTLRSRSSGDRLVSRRRRRPKAAAAIGDLSWACRRLLYPMLPNNDRGATE